MIYLYLAKHSFSENFVDKYIDRYPSRKHTTQSDPLCTYITTSVPRMPEYAGISTFHFPAPLKCLSPLRCSPHFILSSSSLLLVLFFSLPLFLNLYIPLQSPLYLIYAQPTWQQQLQEPVGFVSTP